MWIDDGAEREHRGAMNADWAQVRAKARPPASARPTSAYQSQTRKQIADRVQRAAVMRWPPCSVNARMIADIGA